MAGSRIAVAAIVAMLGMPAPPTHAVARTDVPAPVVVATFDTGTNPLHPCFRRDGSTKRSLRRAIPNYPRAARQLPLVFGESYQESLAASQPALDAIVEKTLYFVPGTNLSFYGLGARAKTHFVDDYPHGAQASSQIACEEYGMAPNSHLVILNWYDDTSRAKELVEWVAEQDWIDVVHLNIQDGLPLPLLADSRSIERLMDKGKMVVIAAGNGIAGGGASYPMELSRWNGPLGSLIAGANDNGGWTIYSNLDPHVVMDGGGTIAAEPGGFGETSFSGTSSASPRVTGYVARIIGELRQEFGHTWNGLVTIPAGDPAPERGPLADGRLTPAELHEVVRRTADPNPHESRYDGGTSIYAMPQPVPLPFAFYPKMGYGEVSEHTIDLAIDVLAGRAPHAEPRGCLLRP